MSQNLCNERVIPKGWAEPADFPSSEATRFGRTKSEAKERGIVSSTSELSEWPRERPVVDERFVLTALVKQVRGLKGRRHNSEYANSLDVLLRRDGYHSIGELAAYTDETVKTISEQVGVLAASGVVHWEVDSDRNVRVIIRRLSLPQASSVENVGSQDAVPAKKSIAARLLDKLIS